MQLKNIIHQGASGSRCDMQKKTVRGKTVGHVHGFTCAVCKRRRESIIVCHDKRQNWSGNICHNSCFVGFGLFTPRTLNNTKKMTYIEMRKLTFIFFFRIFYYSSSLSVECSLNCLFQFESCLRAFARLENRKIHMRSHTGHKPFPCKYAQEFNCTKKFSNSSDRAKHEQTHKDPVRKNPIF